MDSEPEQVNQPVPRQSDRPPVGEPLVVSRRNPAARPAARVAPEVDAATDAVEPVPEPGELDGRVAMVTAATGDVGRALVEELAGRGAHVVLVDDDLTSLVGVADGLVDGVGAVPLRCDPTSPADVASVSDFVSRSVELDLLFHVAVDADVDDDGPGATLTAVEEVGHEVRTGISAPVELVAGVSGALAADARIVFVDPDDRPDLHATSRVACRIVRERLPLGEGVRVASASCGPDVSSDRFAAALVDLVAVGDVPLDRVVVGVRPATART